jgi:integrase
VSDEPPNLPAVVDAAAPVTTPKLQSSVAVPMMITNAGDHAARRFLEFFAAQIRNKNTRMAYHRAACHFFAWVEQHQIGELADIEPIHVAAYIEGLQATAAKPTVKLHLAAIRMLFDWLIIGQVLAVNPAHAVRGPKHVVKRGKTPVLTEEQARQLIQSLDTSTLVGASSPRCAYWWTVGCATCLRREAALLVHGAKTERSLAGGPRVRILLPPPESLRRT